MATIPETEIRQYADQSILCWLATASMDRLPNVSPKEIFDFVAPNQMIIANIASPQTVKNIKENSKVCVSFIDVLVQKGLQIKGNAEIIEKNQHDFAKLAPLLEKKTEGKFPFHSIIKINIQSVKRIIAPRYIFYPETTEEEQIESAKKVYGLK